MLKASRSLLQSLAAGRRRGCAPARGFAARASFWRTFCAALAVSGCLLTAAAGADRPLTAWQGRTMGSDYTIKLLGAGLSGPELDAVKRAVEQRLLEINRQMSHYQPDSELSRFNRAPASIPFKVSSEFARVVRFSLDLARGSHGAFDPTLGPVINLWGFGESDGEARVPTDADLAAARQRTGWRHLQVTGQRELLKDIPDLQLNLSAVAKGFAVDEIGRLLVARGCTNFHVAIAGEVLVRGPGPRHPGWRIGVSAPLEHWREQDPFLAVASLTNQAISTSGDYQKFFRDTDGRRRSHLFDPRTGRPVEHNLAGVSVVAPDSMTADALGTVLFVLGVEDGLRLLANWPDASAFFILREPNGTFRSRASPGFPIAVE